MREKNYALDTDSNRAPPDSTEGLCLHGTCLIPLATKEHDQNGIKGAINSLIVDNYSSRMQCDEETVIDLILKVKFKHMLFIFVSAGWK